MAWALLADPGSMNSIAWSMSCWTSWLMMLIFYNPDSIVLPGM